jgi:hypothetical protein
MNLFKLLILIISLLTTNVVADIEKNCQFSFDSLNYIEAIKSYRTS